LPFLVKKLGANNYIELSNLFTTDKNIHHYGHTL